MDIPVPFRIVLLALMGACLGAAINALAGRAGRRVRAYSPWLPPLADAPKRRWDDRLPIVGWLGLRRESSVHGGAHWIGPMFTELFVAVAIPFLYWWEVVEHNHLFSICETPSSLALHLQFLAHATLLLWMVAASVVDFQDRIIPDSITVTGVLIGLAFAAIMPSSMLTVPDFEAVQQAFDAGVNLSDDQLPTTFLSLSYPGPWPPSMNGAPLWRSLAVALFCWWAWCLALMPNVWYTVRGAIFAIRFNLASRFRGSGPRWWIGGAVGSLLIAWCWSIGGPAWAGLLTSLVGVAGAEALIWSVRIVARHALQREAMGFGDVTLMAMIGAFLGWQPAMLVFFLAPLAGVVLGVVSLIVKSDDVIPYGPFLCMGAGAVILFWPPIWEYAFPAFSFGWLAPATFAICMLIMWAMLKAWDLIATLIWGPVEE